MGGGHRRSVIMSGIKKGTNSINSEFTSPKQSPKPNGGNTNRSSHQDQGTKSGLEF